MDRITIVIKSNSVERNTIFLHKDMPMGSNATDQEHILQLGEQSAGFQTAYTSFINEAKTVFDARQPMNAERWVVDMAISADPTDATIERRAYANMPIQYLDRFEMPVTIRHFRGGVSIADEKKQFVEVMYARLGRMIDVGGVQTDEYLHFEQQGRTYPMPTVITGAIANEDAVGRFNTQAG